MVFGINVVIISVIFIVMAIFVAYFVSCYNALSVMYRNTKKAEENIDAVLNKRIVELPKLITYLRVYMNKEREILEEITSARNALSDAKTAYQKIEADKEISASLESLFQLVEKYPILKSNERFIHTYQRVIDIEKDLSEKKEAYNECAKIYNQYLNAPSYIVVVKLLNFEALKLLE